MSRTKKELKAEIKRLNEEIQRLQYKNEVAEAKYGVLTDVIAAACATVYEKAGEDVEKTDLDEKLQTVFAGLE